MSVAECQVNACEPLRRALIEPDTVAGSHASVSARRKSTPTVTVLPGFGFDRSNPAEMSAVEPLVTTLEMSMTASSTSGPVSSRVTVSPPAVAVTVNVYVPGGSVRSAP